MARRTNQSSARRAQFDPTLTQGPIRSAVWKLAWPTMLQNVIAGLQGLVDHAMVGHFVGHQGNAAIGVSWQIFLVVVVFVSSLFTGMGVLVARFAGAQEAEKVNRTVYQAFLTALLLAFGVLVPVGLFLTPTLLDFLNATPEVKAEALPYLRTMFLFSFGSLLFFMLNGALRAAGDAKTPLRLGMLLTGLNLLLNIVLIPGLGPVPAFGAHGAAIGTVTAAAVASGLGLFLLFRGDLPIRFSRALRFWPDLSVIRLLFKFGLPTGFQGIAMNVGGVLLLRYVGSLPASAEAQAAYTVSYTQLFSLITWTSVGLMGAASAVAGQNLGAGQPLRVRQAAATTARMGLSLALGIGLVFVFAPDPLLRLFGLDDPVAAGLARQLLGYLGVSGLFITVALTYTGALQGTGDTRSPLYITLVSQLLIPIGLCATFDALGRLEAEVIWLAIVLGHATRAVLSWLRFRQGAWSSIQVRLENEGA